MTGGRQRTRTMTMKTQKQGCVYKKKKTDGVRERVLAAVEVHVRENIVRARRRRRQLRRRHDGPSGIAAASTHTCRLFTTSLYTYTYHTQNMRFTYAFYFGGGTLHVYIYAYMCGKVTIFGFYSSFPLNL